VEEFSNEELNTGDVKGTQKICGLDRYPKQMDPKVREQNVRIPELLKGKLEHLTKRELDAIRPVVLKYQDLFKKTEDGTIPYTGYGSHEIRTGDARPVKKQPYRVPYALRDEMKRQIEEMKERGVLSEAATEWAAPVILVHKKSPDGTPKHRFCADFRGLNAITQVPVYTMPLVQEYIDRLNGNRYFTLIDMQDAYHHIPIKPEDKPKTGIKTLLGSYQYERLAFGLAGAPSTFTKVIDRVLLGLGTVTCLIYMDNILIFAKTIEEHAERLGQVFEWLRSARFTLNLAKCHFAEGQVEYLGHCVTQDGVRPSEGKVKAIKNFPRPRTVRDVKSFLGLSGYYRQYIPNYAGLGQPLTASTKKGHRFSWGRSTGKGFSEAERGDKLRHRASISKFGS
jgi:hypothetical protein